MTTTRTHPTTGIKLGEKYRDQVHGSVGTATSVTEYLHGCARVCIEWINADDEVVERYVDIAQLTHVETNTPMHARPAPPPHADGAVAG